MNRLWCWKQLNYFRDSYDNSYDQSCHIQEDCSRSSFSVDDSYWIHLSFWLLCRIATSLVKIILFFSTQVLDRQLNSISQSFELMHITHLQTISSQNHFSLTVTTTKKSSILFVAIILLEASVSRKKAMTADSLTSSQEIEKLAKNVTSMSELIETIKCEEDHACNNWDMKMIWIVARKVIIVNENEFWMSAKYSIW